jgi:uncharacterized protein
VTYSSTEFGFLLRLEPGDEVIRCLIQFAREHELDAALVTGSGAVVEADLGAAGSQDHEHRRRRLEEPLVACSLTGTLTLLDGEPFPCVHGTFARADHSVVGGHVFEAVSAGTVELALQVAADAAIRSAAHGHYRTGRTAQ